eukprot:4284718-Pyramimonas_sp.AAC.2
MSVGTESKDSYEGVSNSSVSSWVLELYIPRVHDMCFQIWVAAAWVAAALTRRRIAVEPGGKGGREGDGS